MYRKIWDRMKNQVKVGVNLKKKQEKVMNIFLIFIL